MWKQQQLYYDFKGRFNFDSEISLDILSDYFHAIRIW